MSPENLTAGAVLLSLVLTLGGAWVRDRNARIRDLKEQVARLEADRVAQVAEWREAHRLSELARETQAEIARGAVDIARTNEAVITGLRTALTQLRGSDSA